MRNHMRNTCLLQVMGGLRGGVPTVYVFSGRPLDAKSQCRLKAVEERGSRSRRRHRRPLHL